MLKKTCYFFAIFITLLLLFITSIKYLVSAEHRLQAEHATALAQAQKLIDYMEDNPIAARSGHYDSQYLATLPVCRNCNHVEQAQIDLLNWQMNNRLYLPMGKGKVEYDGESYSITVNWKSKQNNPQCSLQNYHCITKMYEP